MKNTHKQKMKDQLIRSFEVRLHVMHQNIKALMVTRDKLGSDIRKIQRDYAEVEMEYSKLIDNPIDNTMLIHVLDKEEAVYQARFPL